MAADENFDGLASIVRLTGSTIPQRARFIGETILSASLSSISLGLLCGQLGGCFASIGPLVPFMLGSWTGYTFGLLGHWKGVTRQARFYSKMYPALMAHSLKHEWDILVPRRAAQDGAAMTEWVEEGGIGRLTMVVLTAASVKPEVEEILAKEKQKMVEVYTNPPGAEQDD